MKLRTLLALLLGLSSLSITAHGEGGCPPGWMPYSSTNVSSCGPIPGYNDQQQTAPQPPSPQWADRWGAIATFEPNGSLGTAINMPTQSSAEQTAVADCQSKHGSTCKVQLSYRNQCAAMVVGGKIFNVNPGTTVEAAAQTGMNMCRSAANDCHVYYSACSPPVRIQ